MEDYKNRYGNLLDNVMNRKDDKMVNTAEEFMDSMAANKQAEIDRLNSAMNARESKEQAECDRLKQTNEALEKWVNVSRRKEEEKQRQHEAEQQAIMDAEMRRQTIQNMNWAPPKRH